MQQTVFQKRAQNARTARNAAAKKQSILSFGKRPIHRAAKVNY